MRLPFGLDLGSFLAGVGFVLVLALIVFLVSIWWKDVTSPFRPQVVVQTTKKTPWQVVFGAFGALFQYVGFALIVAAVALLLVFGFSLTDVRFLGLAGIVILVLGSLMRLIA